MFKPYQLDTGIHHMISTAYRNGAASWKPCFTLTGWKPFREARYHHHGLDAFSPTDDYGCERF